MKQWKRAMTGILSAAMLFTLAACGTDKDPIQAAAEKLAKVKNMDSHMTMEMEMEAQGQAMSMTTDMAITMFSDPMMLKADINLEITGMGTQAVTVYAEGTQEAFDMYMSMDGINWDHSNGTATELAEFNTTENMMEYLNTVIAFQEAGTETLDGGEATKYTGTIPKTEMEEILRSSGALDSLGSVMGPDGLDSELVAQVLSGLEDLPISVWVDKANGYPVKLEMDMSNMMAAITEKILESTDAQDAELKFTKMTLAMTCQNIDSATAFEIPAEAKAA